MTQEALPPPKRKGKGGYGRGNKFVPTEKDRAKVKSLAAIGRPHDEICLLIGIGDKALRKHFKEELSTAAVEANAIVAGKLFQKCLNGDTASIIFWCKTRMNMKETITVDNPLAPPDWFTKGKAIEVVLVQPERRETPGLTPEPEAPAETDAPDPDASSDPA